MRRERQVFLEAPLTIFVVQSSFGHLIEFDLPCIRLAREARGGHVDDRNGHDSLFQRDRHAGRGRHDEASDDSTAPFRHYFGLGTGYTELSRRPSHSHERDVTIGFDLRQGGAESARSNRHARNSSS